MSEQVRRLERTYRESGAASDLLGWLNASRRAGLCVDVAPWVLALATGEVTQEQIELAAFLGDPLALHLDEERAISLASFLSQDYELVPIVLGEPPEQSFTLSCWIASLAHWNPSWVVEAQLAIAEHACRSAPSDTEPLGDYYAQESWEEHLERCQSGIQAAWNCLNALNATTLARAKNASLTYPRSHVSELVNATLELTEHWGKGWHLSPTYIDLGANPNAVPEVVRAGLLPKVLRVA